MIDRPEPHLERVASSPIENREPAPNEADARWRLRGGAWVVRLEAVFYALSAAVTLSAVGGAFAQTAALSVGAAALLLVGAHHLERGSRVAACALLGFFALSEAYARLVARQLSGPGIVFGLLVVAALGNAAWGAFSLHRVRRVAATPVPSDLSGKPRE